MLPIVVGFPKKMLTFDNRIVLFINIVVRLPDKAFNDLLTLSPGHRIVAAHRTLHSSHIVWKPAILKVNPSAMFKMADLSLLYTSFTSFAQA